MNATFHERATLDELAERYRIPDAWRDLNLGGEPLRLCRAPYRDDRSPSLSLFDDGRRFRDFGTGENGRVFDFVARCIGCSFEDAVSWIRERVGDVSTEPHTRTENTRPKPTKQTPRADKNAVVRLEHTMDESELRQCRETAKRLADDVELCGRIGAARGWKADTVRELATGHDLGWLDDSGRGGHAALVFLYDTGAKCRAKNADGSRVIWWKFGKPCLWRGWVLRGPETRGAFRTAIIFEGESDLISCLDEGLEDEQTRLVALPSASTFASEWAGCFIGLDVILALDNDAAGQAATARVARMIEHAAASVRVVNFNKLMAA